MTQQNTSRNRAVYEQAPWDQTHIENIYRNLQGRIVADNQWHDFPPLPKHIGRYRVFEGRYFQAVYARTPNPVFLALASMPPVEREDDAEWTIWSTGKGKGYVLASIFTVTPYLDGYDIVERCLDRHGLGWEPHPSGLQGVAYFTDLEPGCLADAMDRLVWLEGEVLEVNQRLTRAAGEFWAEACRQSDRIAAGMASDDASDEIIPVPDERPRTSWKRRTPIPWLVQK